MAVQPARRLGPGDVRVFAAYIALTTESTEHRHGKTATETWLINLEFAKTVAVVIKHAQLKNLPSDQPQCDVSENHTDERQVPRNRGEPTLTRRGTTGSKCCRPAHAVHQ